MKFIEESLITLSYLGVGLLFGYIYAKLVIYKKNKHINNNEKLYREENAVNNPTLNGEASKDLSLN